MSKGYESEFNASIKYLEQLCLIIDAVNITYLNSNLIMCVKTLDILQTMSLPRLTKTTKEKLNNLRHQRNICILNATPKNEKNSLLREQVHNWFTDLNQEIHKAGLMMIDKASEFNATEDD